MKTGRHAVLLLSATLVACGGAAAPVLTTLKSPEPGAGSRPNPALIPAHLWVEHGSQETASIAVVDAKGQRTVQSLPMGVLSRDSSRMYAVATANGGNRLVAVDTRTGATIASTGVPADVQLPTLGPSQRPAGLSPDGHHLVLAGGTRASDGSLTTSRFLVYDTANLPRSPLTVSLSGEFTFDGVSNSAFSLYLLENLNSPTRGGDYHVRRYDLAAGALDPNVIVDKSTGERSMGGSAIDSVNSADGTWQFTAYAFGPRTPFVHALNLDAGVAFCIDLPSAPSDEALDLLWAVLASPDGGHIYAVNAANGAVLDITSDSPWRYRQATLPVSGPAPAAMHMPWDVATVYAKRIVFGAAAINPDGATLYALAGQGVAMIDTSTLHLRGTLLPQQALASLTMSADGRHLYAVSADSAALLQIDSDSGGWTAVGGVNSPLSVIRVFP